MLQLLAAAAAVVAAAAANPAAAAAAAAAAALHRPSAGPLGLERSALEKGVPDHSQLKP